MALTAPVVLGARAEVSVSCTTDNSANDETAARFAKITALEVSSIAD